MRWYWPDQEDTCYLPSPPHLLHHRVAVVASSRYVTYSCWIHWSHHCKLYNHILRFLFFCSDEGLTLEMLNLQVPCDMTHLHFLADYIIYQLLISYMYLVTRPACQWCPVGDITHLHCIANVVVCSPFGWLLMHTIKVKNKQIIFNCWSQWWKHSCAHLNLQDDSETRRRYCTTVQIIFLRVGQGS